MHIESEIFYSDRDYPRFVLDNISEYLKACELGNSWVLLFDTASMRYLSSGGSPAIIAQCEIDSSGSNTVGVPCLDYDSDLYKSIKQLEDLGEI